MLDWLAEQCGSERAVAAVHTQPEVSWCGQGKVWEASALLLFPNPSPQHLLIRRRDSSGTASGSTSHASWQARRTASSTGLNLRSRACTGSLSQRSSSPFMKERWARMVLYLSSLIESATSGSRSVVACLLVHQAWSSTSLFLTPSSTWQPRKTSSSETVSGLDTSSGQRYRACVPGATLENSDSRSPRPRAPLVLVHGTCRAAAP